MKITKTRLKEIIKEEVEKVVKEGLEDPEAVSRSFRKVMSDRDQLIASIEAGLKQKAELAKKGKRMSLPAFVEKDMEKKGYNRFYDYTDEDYKEALMTVRNEMKKSTSLEEVEKVLKEKSPPCDPSFEKEINGKCVPASPTDLERDVGQNPLEEDLDELMNSGYMPPKKDEDK